MRFSAYGRFKKKPPARASKLIDEHINLSKIEAMSMNDPVDRIGGGGGFKFEQDDDGAIGGWGA